MFYCLLTYIITIVMVNFIQLTIFIYLKRSDFLVDMYVGSEAVLSDVQKIRWHTLIIRTIHDLDWVAFLPLGHITVNTK